MITLTEHFSLLDLTKSNIATKLKIKNTPNPQQIENLTHLAKFILEPIYESFGHVIVNSGFRSRELNSILKGASNSQHLLGEAVDIEVPNISTLELAKWIAGTLDFDQLILEFFDQNVGNTSGWVHVSFNIKKNRRNILHSYKFGKTTRYSSGLI